MGSFETQGVDADNLVFVDFETRSTVDLPKMGGNVYARDATTEIISSVWIKGDELIVWCPGLRNATLLKETQALLKVTGIEVDWGQELPRRVIDWIAEGHTWVAHNADGFDSQVWNYKFGHIYGNPTWLDTLHLARICDMPGKLDLLLPLCVPGAKKGDSSAIKFLSRSVLRNGKAFHMLGNAELWKRLLVYNVQDVIYLREMYERLCELCDGTLRIHIPRIEASREVDMYGIKIDIPYLDKLVNQWSRIGTESVARANKITNGVNLASPDQVIRWLRGMGVKLPNDSLDKRTLDGILAKPHDYFDEVTPQVDRAVEVLKLRQNVASTSSGKLLTMKRLSDEDGVIHNWSLYHGSHTGRSSSVGAQLHNMPRGIDLDSWPDVDQPIEDHNVLATLTRTCLVPHTRDRVLVPMDYSAIEARFAAWFVGCNSIMEIYKNNGDPYRSFASAVFGVPLPEVTKAQRFVGKQGILACQYQVGGDKLNAMCEMFGVDLASVGVTAKQVVETYRKTYPEYPTMWKMLNSAIIGIVQGEMQEAAFGPNGCLRIYMHQGGLMIQTPMGRTLRYNSPRIQASPAPWNPELMLPGVWYHRPYKGMKSIYGGFALENIVQACCNDIFMADMIDGLAKYRELDYSIVLHAHDEIVWEVPKANVITSCNRIGCFMSRQRTLYPGLVLGCEGFYTDRYVKKPIGVKELTYVNGREINAHS